MRIEIIYEDRDVIVIYKPAGLATQTARVDQIDVVSELKKYLGGGKPYVGIVHRLDQPVEGLLVFAKSKPAAAKLTLQLQGKESEPGLNKNYYAVTARAPMEKEGKLENLLYKNTENKAEIVEEHSPLVSQAKKASLSFCMKASSKTPVGDVLLHLFDIQLYTGRFHQIRAQMSHAGMPLLGDSKYGDDHSKSLSKTLGVRDVALCAYKIEFCHPTDGRVLSFEVKPKGKIFGLF